MTAVQAITIAGYEFNGFDTAVLVLLGVSALFAFFRGFLREAISIIALVVAVVVALFVFGQFRYDVQGVVSPPELADGLLLFGGFAVAYAIVAALLNRMKRGVSRDGPGFIDRLLGAGFGVARGLVLAALVVMALTAKHRASQEAAEFRQLVERGGVSAQILDKLPRSMREQMEAEPTPLPGYLQGSTFYPLLERIGAAIRGLPFADMRSYAERIKDGDLDGLLDGN